MRTEKDKSIVELEIFQQYVVSAKIPIIPGTIEKRSPPEPDILCQIDGRGQIAFELTEACAPEFAAIRSKPLEAVPVTWGGDVSEATLLKKLERCYPTAYPVELLVYTNAATPLPDSVLISKLEPLLVGGFGPFEAVWFFGDAVHVLARGA